MGQPRSERRVVVRVGSLIAASGAWLALASATSAAPQSPPVFEGLHSFGPATEGGWPLTAPIVGTDGALYGATSIGGTNDAGVIYRIAPDGSGYTVVHEFAHDGNGSIPLGVLQGQDGALYGVTAGGGLFNMGAVFRVEVDGSGYQRLHSMAGANGANPQFPLIEGPDGTLYGGTVIGGAFNGGTLFRIAPDGTGFGIVHDFVTAPLSGAPIGNLVFGSDGLLYGATCSVTGTYSRDTLYKVAPDGSGFTTLHDSGTYPYRFTPGPFVTEGSDGALYVADSRIGPNDEGRIFTLQRDGSGFTELHGFDSTLTGLHSPNGQLLEGLDGALYGPVLGGAHDGGALFTLQKDGSGAAALFDLDASTMGSPPNGPLLQASDGTLFGVTRYDGADGGGTLYAIQPDGSGHALLRSFGQTDGRLPIAGVIEGSDGRLYGATQEGGSEQHGTLFAMARDGSGYEVLHRFERATDGALPMAELLQASDGALYGTTTAGGANDGGTLFTIQTDGSGFVVLRDLDNTAHLETGPLIEGADGKLYGTAPNGSDGEVFKLNKNGTAWSVLSRLNHTNKRGLAPLSGLLQASDGLLYGVAAYGGNPVNAGSIWKLNTDGTGFTVLLKFDGSGGAARGQNPWGELIEGQDGALYGTTRWGGSLNGGTAFKIQKNGTGLQFLHDFTLSTVKTDGGDLNSGLLQRIDGSLWGVAKQGGAFFSGTLYTLQPDGSGFAPVHAFDFGAGGAYPCGRLCEAQDGELYGSAQRGGGPLGLGLLFRLHVDCSATWSNYGTGFPGTAGIPTLTAQAPPVLGTTLTVDAGNSAPSATVVAVLVGTQSAQLPMKKGGDLLVVPDVFLIVPLPAGGTSLAEGLDDDPSLCGLELFVQTLVVDPGAAKGQAASAGLRLVLGY